MNNVLFNNPGRTAEEREQHENKERERLATEALKTQTVKYAVAPGQAMTSSRGVILDAGHEVTLADFHHTELLDDGTPVVIQEPEVLLGACVARGLVIEKAGA